MSNSLPDGTRICDYGGIPVDRLAWRVIQPGEHFVSKKKVTELIFDAAPPARSTRRGVGDKEPENLKGRRAGQLVVWGYWGRKSKKGGSENQVWVCRCVCGVFVTRTGKTIKAGRDPYDKCSNCRQLEYIKKVDYFRQIGKWPDHWRIAGNAS